jgi:formylglycine-generating enzyme required for sulfatase activity
MGMIVTDPNATVGGPRKPRDVAFCIDTHEFPGAGSRPRTNVSSAQAAGLCKKAGKALCTAQRWGAACGSFQFQDGDCNTSGKLQETGSHGPCRTADGIFDMVGNAGEWTSDGRLRGGDIGTGRAASCTYSTKRFSPRATDGFRCCADPLM